MPRQEEQFQVIEFTRVRQNIARHTLTSITQVPQFPLTVLVDMEPLIALREELKLGGTQPLPTYNDLMLKAVGLTLRQHRRFCAWVSDNDVRVLENINVGFAVASDQGVLIPTVREVDRKSLTAIATETAELIELARTGKLRASLQMGAGFTISNLGPVGIDAFAPIISPPQAGILGVGSIMPHPMVVEGQVVARRSAFLTLVMDHRSSDGADGAAFLVTLRDLLSAPQRLREQ